MDPDITIGVEAETVRSIGEEAETVSELSGGSSLGLPKVHQPLTAVPPKSLRNRALHGSVWTFAGYGGSQVIRFGANIVLARLLFPWAFGLMALINVLMQGLQMFSDLGVGPAIIKHSHDDDPDFFNTAWTMQVIRGFVLWVVACALAVPLAKFYRTDELATMIPLAALTALFAGFNSTKLFIEGRDLRLARVVGIEVLSQIVAVVAMVLLAICWRQTDWAVYSLIFGGLLGSLVKVGLSHVAIPGMKNRFCLNRQAMHHLYHFGRWIFISTLFTFLAMQIDRVILPYIIHIMKEPAVKQQIDPFPTAVEANLTAAEPTDKQPIDPIAELGIYSIALGFVSIGVGVFEQFANRILMPAMAHIKRNSHHRFDDMVRQSRKYILSMAVIAVANLILLAPSIFFLLYDERYRQAGWIARWLGFGLWFVLLQRTSQASLLALGHTKVLALANAVNFVITIICAPFGYYLFGLNGFIVGWSLGNLAAAIIVDSALSRDGIPLLRQDAVLTIGLILFVVIGILIRQHLQVHSVFTAHAIRIKVVVSALMTMVSAALIYLEYRRSPMSLSGPLNIETNGVLNPLPEKSNGILSNGSIHGVNGTPINDVVCRD